MAVERYASKTDVVVKLILVFFISLLSFSIGTFVGKKFSDNQHKLAQMEPGHGGAAEATAETEVAGEAGKGHEERSVASVAHDVTEVKPNQALSDEEIAKLAEEFVTDDEGGKKGEKSAEAHGDKHAEAAPAHEAPAAHAEAKHEAAPAHDAHAAPAAYAEAKHEAAPAHDAHAAPAAHEPVRAAASVEGKKAEPSAAAAKVAEGHDPAHGTAAHGEEKAAKAANTIPTALPKEVAASALGKYTVQVASYPKEEEAQNMANELKAKGFSAFYIAAKVKGNTWYRVSVGMFATSKEAQAYRNDLLARAKVSSAIVQQIVQ